MKAAACHNQPHFHVCASRNPLQDGHGHADTGTTTDPGFRTFSPTGICAKVSTSFSSPEVSKVETSLVSSTMITVSAPAGKGPPVLIR